MTLHPADLDRTVDPGVDFYRFANGGWLDANPIPPGYGSWGAFEEVVTRNEKVLHDLLMRAAEAPETDLDRQLGDFFASGLDVDGVQTAGLRALQPLLDVIDGIADHDGVWAALPALHRTGIFGFFGWDVTVDHDDATRYLLWLAQAGLGLPDRDSYFPTTDAARDLLAAYQVHVAAQLRNLGTPDDEAATLAAGVVALETRLAELHFTGAERRDPGNTLNRHDRAQLAALAPQLDLPAHLDAVGGAAAVTVNVQCPRLFAGLHDVVADTDVAVVRAYLRFMLISAVADALPTAFEQEAFEFYGRRVRGQQQPHERTKRVIDAVTADMGEALSQRFVAATFPPSAKERAMAMVQAIVDEMRHSLQTRTWMSDATRARGLTKLDAIGVKIGYPDEWRDWSGLTIDRTDYAGNRLRATAFQLARAASRIDQPVDTTEWEMPPHVVNAYYHPVRNEIVFPAGILQPPMFDADADDAVNFGGIGTVIAHEISHGFDDQGRRFDADGAFRDWWEPEDEAAFTAITDRLAAQFDAYTVLGELHVNGRLTLGENIADLGGVALAQRAHARVSDGAPSIDDLTPTQRFFVANATLWRANVSEELQRTLVQTDPHSPRHLRVLGPVSNMPAFRDAFGLADDAPMLRAPEDRIEIW